MHLAFSLNFCQNSETTKGLFVWSRVAETTLPQSYPGRDIFPLICLKMYINRLPEVGETPEGGGEGLIYETDGDARRLA